MAAVLENDVFALQAALKSGARIDVTDSRGHSPLDVALAQGNAFSGPDMVHILSYCKKGALSLWNRKLPDSDNLSYQTQVLFQ